MKHWVTAAEKFPVVTEDDMLRKSINESSEPVVGRLGIYEYAQRRHLGISRETVKSGCAREWGGWGRLSDDGPGQHNPDRSEGPWGRAARPARTEVFISASSLTQSRESRWQQRARRTKANQYAGKASSDSPALKPYRGKPAVRNFRGGDGNVDIIRSPVRAIALPDCAIWRKFAESGEALAIEGLRNLKVIASEVEMSV